MSIDEPNDVILGGDHRGGAGEASKKTTALFLAGSLAESWRHASTCVTVVKQSVLACLVVTFFLCLLRLRYSSSHGWEG